ncbi:MAG: heavy metal translocating P-type ATPase [Candidatus Jordarchaeum sp.]|uniref:heavy metal translocating P-type ATPase n=1 Tax=Candidatus Jordarchaeum sp. TaxID=2823881 RepID=UPI00404A19FD
MVKGTDKETECQTVCELEGLHCADCADRVEKVLSTVEGVNKAKVNFAARKLTLDYDKEKVSIDEIKETAKKIGYNLRLHERPKSDAKKYLLDIIRIASIGVLMFLSWANLLPSYMGFDVSVIAVALGAYPILKDAFFSLRAKEIDVSVFMSIAIIATVLLREFLSAAAITFFVLIAWFIEEFTVDKSRKAIQEIMEIAPKNALVLRDGKEILLPVEEIRITDVVIVRSGEKISVDGRIVSGEALVNQSPITGESMPVEKNAGDAVFAGTINEIGVIQIRVERTGGDTTIGRIIKLVEEAQEGKAPIQKIADRFTAYFTPLVLALSFLTYLLTNSVITAVTVLIVACPCAVALATPLAVIATIGKSSKRGSLVKGGDYLEALGRVNTIAMDKTGTLTINKPKVIDVKSFDGHSEEEIVQLAAIAEKRSEHPMAIAIMKKAERYGVNVPTPDNSEIIRGKGVIVHSNGKRIILGNRELMKNNNVKLSREVTKYMKEREEEGKTALLISHDGYVCGVITIADAPRKNAQEIITELKKLGMKTIMLTGDNPRTARAIADQLGIDEVIAEMLPDDKAKKIRELEDSGQRVAMVGDGINDAPALVQATVGIAMGVAGTAAAMEAADIVLMADDLAKIPEIIRAGKKTIHTIKQNIAIGILFNIVGVGLASFGFLTPFLAAVAHFLPDLVVSLNSSKLII